MNLSEYKDIIKQAIANEVEAKKFYEDAANTLKDPHLKNLFASLAEEEKKHRDILTKIFSSNTMERYFSESRDYKVAETVDEPDYKVGSGSHGAGSQAENGIRLHRHWLSRSLVDHDPFRCRPGPRCAA